MADPIVINFAGKPVPWARTQINIGKGRPIPFTPAKQRTYAHALRYTAQQEMVGRPLINGPVSLSLAVSLPIPASWSQKKQREALAGRVMPTSKPDLSNYLKLVEDTLNCVVFRDDSQIVFHMLSKRYSDRPGIRIEVSEITQAEEAKAA